MRRSSYVVIAVSLLLTLLAAPAGAAVLTGRDASGDVVAATIDPDTWEMKYQHSATPNGDVVSSRYEVTRHQVSLYLRYREIYVPKTASGWEFLLEGSNGVRRGVDLTATRDTVGGRAHLVRMSGKRVDCTVASKINYTTNSVKVVFPRRCLGNPRSVRVGQVSFWVSFRDQPFIYYDDPARTGGSLNGIGAPGRWIKAG